MPRPHDWPSQLPTERLVPDSLISLAYPEVQVQDVLAHLLTADVLGELLPQATGSSGSDRFGTGRLLRPPADRSLVSLLEDDRDPASGAARAPRDPLSCTVS